MIEIQQLMLRQYGGGSFCKVPFDLYKGHPNGYRHLSQMSKQC